MKISSLVFGAAAISLFFGCTSPYIVPKDGETANLRYITNQPNGYTNVFLMNTSQCPNKVDVIRFAGTLVGGLIEYKELSSVNMLGTSDKEEVAVRERVVEAGKQFNFKIHAANTAVLGTPGYSCSVFGSFMPQTQKNYEISHEITKTHCRATVFLLTKDNLGGIKRTREESQKYFYARDDIDFCKNS